MQLLQEKHDLPQMEQYSYAQIAHFINSLRRRSDLSTTTPMDYLCGGIDKHSGYISTALWYFVLYQGEVTLHGEMGAGHGTCQNGTR